MKDNIPTLKQMPALPTSVTFSLAKVEKITHPHPYCITPRHVAWAADHFGGMLGTDAIRDAEKHGATCEICQKSGRGILSIDQHQTDVTLFINVPQNRDLNAIPKLHAYLFDNKAKFAALGIQGFAFPLK
jgi:hypothetical protein